MFCMPRDDTPGRKVRREVSARAPEPVIPVSTRTASLAALNVRGEMLGIPHISIHATNVSRLDISAAESLSYTSTLLVYLDRSNPGKRTYRALF